MDTCKLKEVYSKWFVQSILAWLQNVHLALEQVSHCELSVSSLIGFLPSIHFGEYPGLPEFRELSQSAAQITSLLIFSPAQLNISLKT
jgi:hypothetical protein